MENVPSSFPAPPAQKQLPASGNEVPGPLLSAPQSMDALRNRVTELETILVERERRIAELRTALLNQEIRLALHASRFLRERTLLSPELAFKAFGHRFQVKENGKERQVVPMGEEGPLQSQRHPGQTADVDEALALFMESDPDMLPLLRATPGGAGTGGTAQGLRVIPATDSAAFSRNIDDIAAGRVLVR